MEENGSKDEKINRIISEPYIPYVTALIGAYGVQGIMALGSVENIRYSNSIFSLFVFFLGAYVLVKIQKLFLESDKAGKRRAVVFSFLLSVALCFGARLETAENVHVDDLSLWLHIMALSIFLVPVVTVSWSVIPGAVRNMCIGHGIDSADPAKNVKPMKLLQIWGIILLLWLPTFLALYPGAFVYDAQEEYIEVISRTFTTHHPLLHVLILGGMVHGAEYLGYTANTGIAAYVLLQMIVMSGILTYTVKRLELLGLRKAYLTGVIIFYGLFPLFPLYAVCTAKDGLFTVFLLLIIVELFVYVVRVEEFNPTVFTAAAVLMMLMRNNGIYAFAFAMLLILAEELIRTCKEKGKETASDNAVADGTVRSAGRMRVYKLMILTLLSLVLFFGINFVLKTAVQAKDNEHQEILTVPIQQLARVYTYSKDVFDEADIDIIHRYLPEENLLTYRFRVSDLLKSGFNNAEYERDKSSFKSLWGRIGLRKPLIYLNAWFGTSYGYWYPDAINNVYAGNQMYSYSYSDSSYFGFETEPPGIRDSKFPILERFYEDLSLKLFQQKLPVISMLFSPGFMWWLCAFMTGCALSKGRTGLGRIIPIVPAVAVWLTVLLGPTTLVRYVLILWFAIPLYPLFET